MSRSKSTTLGEYVFPHCAASKVLKHVTEHEEACFDGLPIFRRVQERDNDRADFWNRRGGSQGIPAEPAKSEIPAQQIQSLADDLAQPFLTSA